MVQKCDNDINLLLGKGFQLNTINGIYMRSAYSYKENKQTKKKVERQFIDNLSVDRSDGNLISVRM